MIRNLAVVCTVLLMPLSQAERDWSQIETSVHPALEALQANFESRIVGGQEATPHQFPYQVALLINKTSGGSFCGGSLISANYVLTAAHCVDKADTVEVVLGAHNIRQNETSQQRLTAKNIKVHSQWNPSTNENDIALLELPEAAKINDYVKVVSLPSRSDVSNSFAKESATVSGWGKDSDKATTVSDVLRYVVTKVISNFVCTITYLGAVRSTNICTSGWGGTSTCNGDSGGPLVIGNKQIGIVSFGIKLGCEKNWPAVFTRVTSYLDWIAQNSDATIS